jgi:glutamate dehydrogenase/leucine dehydrogenase
MAWTYDEIGRAVGLPRVLGGIPLDEIGATGFGIAQCAEVTTSYCDLKLSGARVAIQGFGNVGRNAARYLAAKGAVLVAASDRGGAVCDPGGIDVEELVEVKRRRGSVAALPGAEQLSHEALFTVQCDILIPAARPDCIHADNAREIQAKVVLQGANIPATADAEAILYQRGVLNVPDFIANAGGVICAAVEYHGGSQADAFEQIAEKIRRNTGEVLARSRDEKISPRQAALELARERVETAMALRASS